jgi:hypothetical protein
MSQKENTEWRNVRLGCKHVVHRVYVHPILWDACCSSLESKLQMFGLKPLSIHQSVDGK